MTGTKSGGVKCASVENMEVGYKEEDEREVDRVRGDNPILLIFICKCS